MYTYVCTVRPSTSLADGSKKRRAKIKGHAVSLKHCLFPHSSSLEKSLQYLLYRYNYTQWKTKQETRKHDDAWPCGRCDGTQGPNMWVRMRGRSRLCYRDGSASTNVYLPTTQYPLTCSSHNNRRSCTKIRDAAAWSRGCGWLAGGPMRGRPAPPRPLINRSPVVRSTRRTTPPPLLPFHLSI